MHPFKTRLAALLLCASLLLAALALPAAAEEAPAEELQLLLLGDVNGDGQRTSLDYIMLKRHVLGTYAIPEGSLPAADINGSGEVDATDYLLLKRHLLGTYTIPADDERALRLALAFSYLLYTSGDGDMLALDGELGFELETINQLIVDCLALLSVEGEELLEIETTYSIRLDTLLDLLLRAAAEMTPAPDDPADEPADESTDEPAGEPASSGLLESLVDLFFRTANAE